jgi:hypothetical protein
MVRGFCGFGTKGVLDHARWGEKYRISNRPDTIASMSEYDDKPWPDPPNPSEPIAVGTEFTLEFADHPGDWEPGDRRNDPSGDGIDVVLRKRRLEGFRWRYHMKRMPASLIGSTDGSRTQVLGAAQRFSSN